METNIIEIKYIKNELRTDSRLLAPYLDHRHRVILENLDAYLNEMKELGELPFRTERGKLRPQGGFSNIRYALLNEYQCYFLLTLMRNNPHVVKCKLALVAFKQAREELALRDIARIEGKKIRLEETREIKLLTEYAEANGSKNAERYYIHYTKLANSIFNLQTGQRDTLSDRQLTILAAAESVIKIAISDGVSANIEYHDIYKIAKLRVESLVTSFNLVDISIKITKRK